MDEQIQYPLSEEGRFSFNFPENNQKSNMSNLHKEYVEQYQKYSASNQDPFHSFNMDEISQRQTLKQQHWKKITPEKINRQQLIVRQLQMHNSELTKEISQSQKYLKQLEERLLAYEVRVQQMESVCRHQEDIILQMRQEITLVLDKNQSLEWELGELKRERCAYHSNRELSEMNLQQIEENINRRSQTQDYAKYSRGVWKDRSGRRTIIENNIEDIEMNQLDLRRTSLEQQNSRNKGSGRPQEKREAQLVACIKGMHAKIMDCQTNSLNQLWKWLKDMGQSYSSLRKWKKRAKGAIVSNITSKNQSLAELLFEAFGYLVDS